MNNQNHFNKPGILPDTLQQTWQIIAGIHTVSLKTNQPLQEAEKAVKAMMSSNLGVKGEK